VVVVADVNHLNSDPKGQFAEPVFIVPVRIGAQPEGQALSVIDTFGATVKVGQEGAPPQLKGVPTFTGGSSHPEFIQLPVEPSPVTLS
jgi:hypothetical protein